METIKDDNNNNKIYSDYLEIKEITNSILTQNDEKIKYKTLLKYSNNKTLSKEKSNIIKIFEELEDLSKKNYKNLILPFLLPSCHNLLKAYINSDLDEDEKIISENDYKYLKMFEELKNNIFIDRKVFH